MIKNKKTKTKAPAQAKAIIEVAQTTAKAAIRPAAKIQAVPAATPAKPAQTVKAVEPAKSVAAATTAPTKVRLKFSNPGARSVAIAGSFNSWQPEQAAKTGNGAWVTELNIAPGRYEYLFLVDGQWMADPNAKEFAPNPFGGQNSVLIINK